jgi:hypothetical protein
MLWAVQVDVALATAAADAAQQRVSAAKQTAVRAAAQAGMTQGHVHRLMQQVSVTFISCVLVPVDGRRRAHA